MNLWKIVWVDPKKAHEQCVANGDAVIELVTRLHSNEKSVRPVVEIMKLPSESPSLSIAVGHEETVLTFEESSSPPYYISVGNAARSGTSPRFMHDGQGIDHLARNLVPWSSGLRALLEFLTTAARPGAIDWERL